MNVSAHERGRGNGRAATDKGQIPPKRYDFRPGTIMEFLPGDYLSTSNTAAYYANLWPENVLEHLRLAQECFDPGQSGFEREQLTRAVDDAYHDYYGG